MNRETHGTEVIPSTYDGSFSPVTYERNTHVDLIVLPSTHGTPAEIEIDSTLRRMTQFGRSSSELVLTGSNVPSIALRSKETGSFPALVTSCKYSARTKILVGHNKYVELCLSCQRSLGRLPILYNTNPYQLCWSFGCLNSFQQHSRCLASSHPTDIQINSC